MITRSMSLMATLLLVPVLWATQALAADVHKLAYAEALERLQSAPGHILDEMSRIRNGDVAHFDFLQHAHIELLRDARAVRYPPASLDQHRRDIVKDQADRVLQLGTELELAIADFLRGYALMNAALGSTIDIARTANTRSNPDTQAMLAELGNAASAYRGVASDENRAELMQAFEAVARSQLSDQFKQELAVQRTVIDANEDIVERSMHEAGAARLTMAIAQLDELFRGASPLLGNR